MLSRWFTDSVLSFSRSGTTVRFTSKAISTLTVRHTSTSLSSTTETTALPTTVRPVDCRKKADVVFVVDSTSNLRSRDFRLYVLGTVSDIIQHLDVHSGRTRVAAVRFTTKAKVRLSGNRFRAPHILNDFVKTKFKQCIWKLKQCATFDFSLHLFYVAHIIFDVAQ